MSVKKRRQAKALQRLAARLPLTNLAGLATALLCAYAFSQHGDQTTALTWGLGGALLGLVMFLVLRPRILPVEQRWRSQLGEIGQQLEAKLDDDAGGGTKLQDSYDLEYFGGYPGWEIHGSPAFGQFELYDKYLCFKSRGTRIKLAYNRLHRVYAESGEALRLRKPEHVTLRKMPELKGSVGSILSRFVVRQQVYLALDYQDDLGAKHWVVFSALYGVPWVPHEIKTTLDELMRKLPKEKKSNGTGPLFKTGMLPPITESQIAAAESASRQAMGLSAEGVRYQVVIDRAGTTLEERQAVITQMATVFHLPSDKCAAALERLPFVVRRHLTLEGADQWAKALHEVGATVHVVAMTSESLT